MSENVSLSVYIERKLDVFFKAHSKEVPPTNVYHTVVDEVEMAVIKYVMSYTNNNQAKAAKILGINRNTLRSKLNIK